MMNEHLYSVYLIESNNSFFLNISLYPWHIPIDPGVHPWDPPCSAGHTPANQPGNTR